MEKAMDQELFRIIKEHLLRHPYMQPEDVIKLVFQNEFGPAHLSLEPEEALSHIRNELETVCYEEDALLYEDIGNGYCRVNFRAADPYDYTAEMLAEDFLQSVGDIAEVGVGVVESETFRTDILVTAIHLHGHELQHDATFGRGADFGLQSLEFLKRGRNSFNAHLVA